MKAGLPVGLGDILFSVMLAKGCLLKYIIGLLALALFYSPSAGATILVDLPELTGNYAIGDNPPPASPWTRSMVFTLPDSIESIDGLRFVASGSWTNGQLETCRDVGTITVCDTLPISTNLTLLLNAETLGACHFQATIPAFNAVNGNELLFEVCTEGSSDLNLLLGTTITAELFCDVAPEVLPHIVVAAFGTLTEVRLETVGAVENQQSTWGSIKAQYR